jgi:hypothetical protein
MDQYWIPRTYKRAYEGKTGYEFHVGHVICISLISFLLWVEWVTYFILNPLHKVICVLFKSCKTSSCLHLLCRCLPTVMCRFLTSDSHTSPVDRMRTELYNWQLLVTCLYIIGGPTYLIRGSSEQWTDDSQSPNRFGIMDNRLPN